MILGVGLFVDGFDLSINSCLSLLFYPFCLCAAPSQQPAPVGFALSYSSINLSWHPPDSPNSNRLNYTLIRDGHSVHSIQSHYPFSKYHTGFHTNISDFLNCTLSQHLCLYFHLIPSTVLFFLKALNHLKTPVCLPTPTTLTGL